MLPIREEFITQFLKYLISLQIDNVDNIYANGINSIVNVFSYQGEQNIDENQQCWYANLQGTQNEITLLIESTSYRKAAYEVRQGSWNESINAPRKAQVRKFICSNYNLLKLPV